MAAPSASMYCVCSKGQSPPDKVESLEVEQGLNKTQVKADSSLYPNGFLG